MFSPSTIKVILIAAFLLCAESWGAGWDARFKATFKTIGAYQRHRQSKVFPEDSQLYTEQRLRVSSSLSGYGFLLEAADELSFFYQQPNDSLVPLPSMPRSAWNAENLWESTPTMKLNNRLDRLFLQYSRGPVEIAVGKQVVAVGVGRIFTAISQVPRRAFVVVDPEWPLTEDAATLIWNGPLTFEARLLPKVPGQTQHNFHVRTKGSKGGYDIAMTAGRSDDKIYMGLETAGNLGDALLRAELVGYSSARQEVGQALVGVDYVFSPKLSSQTEVFYNGFGKSGGFAWSDTLHRSTPYRGTFYLGNVLSYEIGPRLKSSLTSIINLADPSGLFNVSLNYSLSENSELILGQFLSIAGHSNSEFGGLLPVANVPGAPSLGVPDLTYLLVKWYF